MNRSSETNCGRRGQGRAANGRRLDARCSHLQTSGLLKRSDWIEDRSNILAQRISEAHGRDHAEGCQRKHRQHAPRHRHGGGAWVFRCRGREERKQQIRKNMRRERAETGAKRWGSSGGGVLSPRPGQRQPAGRAPGGVSLRSRRPHTAPGQVAVVNGDGAAWHA